jgi:hypothetical protein
MQATAATGHRSAARPATRRAAGLASASHQAVVAAAQTSNVVPRLATDLVHRLVAGWAG